MDVKTQGNFNHKDTEDGAIQRQNQATRQRHDGWRGFHPQQHRVDQDERDDEALHAAVLDEQPQALTQSRCSGRGSAFHQ